MLLLRPRRNLWNLTVRQFTMASGNLIKNLAFVNGDWIQADDKSKFDVLNPFDNSKLAQVPRMGFDETNRAIEAANKALPSWKRSSPWVRSQLLRALGDLMKTNSAELATILTSENGKPLVEAKFEVDQAAETVYWYAEEAKRIEGHVLASSDPTAEMLVVREAAGVAALITPWNFPVQLAARKFGPALAAGCTCVIKPAEDTPLSTLAMAALAEKAGFPKGVLNVVTTDRAGGPEVGRALCESEKVAVLSFTGSTRVGKLLYRQCAATVKKVGLELGGVGPFIIFDSANVDEAVEGLMGIKFLNNGQVCITANRVLVQAGIYDKLVQKATETIKKTRVLGNPMKEGVTQGPLINNTQLQHIESVVKDAKDKGANIVVGGKKSDAGKLFFEPTLVTNVGKDMKIYQEEIFGPVLPFVKFDKEEEAVQLANDTRFGLAGYFYSTDVKQCFRVSRALEQGMVYVNNTSLVAVEAPFGGIKESGIGCEGGRFALDEYTNIKYIATKNG